MSRNIETILFTHHIQRDGASLAEFLDFHTFIVKATNTVGVPSQPSHRLVTFLPSGRRYISSRAATTTTRFIPEAVSLLNTLLPANACLTQHDLNPVWFTKLHHTLFIYETRSHQYCCSTTQQCTGHLLCIYCPAFDLLCWVSAFDLVLSTVTCCTLVHFILMYTSYREKYQY